MDNKTRIIIVEDEIDFAKMVKLRLQSVGYEVKIAGDAYTGTQEIIKNHYDLIILDLMMPAGGGYSLLGRIRKIPSKTMVPVIILTGKTINSEDREKAEEYDVAAIFSKPYDSNEFLETVKSLAPIQ
jgi:DNA-binding response OmpR family regulator